MTNIERFQKLQVELVRSGFDTELHAKSAGDQAKLAMFVELNKQSSDGIEKLEALTGGHGFSYTIDDQSRAAITLAA